MLPPPFLGKTILSQQLLRRTLNPPKASTVYTVQVNQPPNQSRVGSVHLPTRTSVGGQKITKWSIYCPEIYEIVVVTPVYLQSSPSPLLVYCYRRGRKNEAHGKVNVAILRVLR